MMGHVPISLWLCLLQSVCVTVGRCGRAECVAGGVSKTSGVRRSASVYSFTGMSHWSACRRPAACTATPHRSSLSRLRVLAADEGTRACCCAPTSQRDGRPYSDHCLTSATSLWACRTMLCWEKPTSSGK